MRQISKDLTAGFFLLAVGGLVSFQGASLEVGTLRQIGPGMLPRGLAVLLGLLGIALMLKGYLERPAPALAVADGPRVDWWRRPSLRGPVCLFAAVCVFGLSVRTLGFIFAGPLVVLLASLASAETRWFESILFAGAMTVFCFLLFKQLLSLPIPVAPWILGY
jgi:putative tricarboxylic transport membrane protein